MDFGLRGSSSSRHCAFQLTKFPARSAAFRRSSWLEPETHVLGSTSEVPAAGLVQVYGDSTGLRLDFPPVLIRAGRTSQGDRAASLDDRTVPNRREPRASISLFRYRVVPAQNSVRQDVILVAIPSRERWSVPTVDRSTGSAHRISTADNL